MSRLIRIATPAGILAVAVAALLMALAYGGSTQAPAGEPGVTILWVLPIAKLIFDLSAAGTVGTLVLACTALSPGRQEYPRAINFAAASAAVWTVTSAVSAFLAFMDASPGMFSLNGSFGPQFGLFLTTVGLGQTWLVTTLVAATVTGLTLIVGNIGSVAMVTLLAIAGMVPLTINSHPNYGPDHEPGMAALGFHIISAAVWLGGMMALVAVRPALRGHRLVMVIRRYSTLALVFFVILAASGFLKAAISLGNFANVWTPYGILVLAKTAALIVLGVAGYVQRRWLISRMGTGQGSGIRSFWMLIVAELLFLGLASGIAVALARTDDPSNDLPTAYSTLAERMADQQLPPTPTVWHYLIETRFDPIWVLLCCAAIFTYLAGVHRLQRRGKAWPVHRTVFWLGGIVVLLYVSNGGVNAYRGFLFSAQTILQMALIALIPLLLVAGAPVVLAGLAIRKRPDGSRGGREWIMTVTGSRLITLATTPLAATGLLLASVLAFSYPPLLEWSITNEIGHQGMIIHFLLAGSLFVTAVTRPSGFGPRAFRRRWAAIAAVSLFYAFLGGALAAGNGLLQPTWYGLMGAPWGLDPLKDQQSAGKIVWITAAADAAVLAAILVSARYRGRSLPLPYSVSNGNAILEGAVGGRCRNDVEADKSCPERP